MSMEHRSGCKESPENYLHGFPPRLPHHGSLL